MKKLLFLMAILWGGGAYGVWYWTDHRTQQVSYRTVALRHGILRSTINATGTIEPEEVVDVGAQVAGRIESFAADPDDPNKTVSFGSRVERGTVLARLDRALFQARLDQARGRVAKAGADIEQAEAKLRQTDSELARCRKLRSRGTAVISEEEYEAAVASFDSAKATVAVNQSALAVANADLEEATVNLGYTTICSPVKGIVIDRRVNIGQIVVASLNGPSLFLIAKDLSRLEIWSSVNETDIGSIHEGQKVQFTVSAFARETFEGKVSQIRLNASMSQNVVTYTVVIAVDNTSGRLLPYLTASVQFEVKTRNGVLLTPNAALRWQPQVQNIIPGVREQYALALRQRTPARGEPASTATTSEDGPMGLLWVRRGDFVKPIKVRLGLSDGLVTEVSGEGLDEGTEVVVGANRVDSDPDALSILPHTWTETPKK